MSFLRSARKFTNFTLTKSEMGMDNSFLDESRAEVLDDRFAASVTSSLSSGQKHLFSILLPIATASIKIAQKSENGISHDMPPDHILIMIDEPEISLHVNWQEDLVQEVEDALRRSNDAGILPPVSVIFATHSPSIIGNHLHRSSCLGSQGESYGE